MNKDDRAHIREMRFEGIEGRKELEALAFMARTGGERDIETINPSWRPFLMSLVNKGLVEPCATHEGGAIFLRITDQGRAIAEKWNDTVKAAPMIVPNTQSLKS